jgi:hypothetical protein
VKIIGDSHLKGSAARINQYLNTKFEVSSFIKPGACTNQIVLFLYFSNKEGGTANTSDGEVCMGHGGKSHGDPDKAPEPHFP